MSAASEAPLAVQDWRRARFRTAVWTFWITVAAGLTFAGLLAPIVAVVLGIVLCLRHRDSPRGPGVLRGGTLVLWTSALLFLALALFEPS